MFRLSASEFDLIVERASKRIPRRFRKLLDNIVVVVEANPPRPDLFGLFRGRPHTVRGVSDSFVPPDQITAYQLPHEQLARSIDELEQMVADTVWLEVGHYFGMSKSEIRQAERRIARLRHTGLA
jgi:predicted Zn-dependent protease with MMP-like domain